MALLQLLSGVFIGMILNKRYYIVIIISALVMSVSTAAMSYNKDALWIIACIVVFIATMIQFMSVKYGIYIKEKYSSKTALPNQSLKGRM